MALVRKILETVLNAGSNTVTFTDTDIPNSLIRVYTSKSYLFPITQTLSGNTITLEYERQSTNTGIALEIVKQGLDIVDDLVTKDATKALSANQGYVLKGLIDDIVIPTVPENITDLDDVDVADIANGQVLAWNSTTEKFENVNQSGGGGSLVETVLWNGSLTAEGTPVTLNDSIQNYDDIIVKWSAYSDGTAYQKTVIIPVSIIETTILYQFCDSIIRNTAQYGFITFGFNDNTSIQITQKTTVSSGVGSGVILQKVIGRKW